METKIVSVKYEDEFEPKTYRGRKYHYFTDIKLKVGDLVVAPTISGTKIARVSEINIPEDKVQMIRHLMRFITEKIDKNAYQQNNLIIKKVA